MKKLLLVLSVVLLAGCQPEDDNTSRQEGMPTDTLTYNQKMILGKWWQETLNGYNMSSVLTRVKEFLPNGECIDSTCINMGDRIDTTVRVDSYSIRGDSLFYWNDSVSQLPVRITKLDSKSLIYESSSDDLGVLVYEYSRLD